MRDDREELSPVPASARQPSTPELAKLDAEDDELLRHFVEFARASNTVKAYKSDLRLFENWCRSRRRQAKPASPETVAKYAAHMAHRLKRKWATIRRAMAAITVAHRAVGLDPPTKTEAVRVALAGIRREIGTKRRQMRPLLPKRLKRIAEAQPHGLRWCRDMALLLVGFAAALRRSELVAVQVEHLKFGKGGVRLLIPTSKTDQDGEGEWLGVPEEPGSATCPVAAVRLWLERGQIEKGYVFRAIKGRSFVDRNDDRHLAPRAVAAVVRRAVRLLGIDAKDFAGHSLRRGLVSACYRKKKPEAAIMKQTRHRSVAQVRDYNAPDLLGDRNAAKGLLA
jgi:integrase